MDKKQIIKAVKKMSKLVSQHGASDWVVSEEETHTRLLLKTADRDHVKIIKEINHLLSGEPSAAISRLLVHGGLTDIIYTDKSIVIETHVANEPSKVYRVSI